MMGGRGVRGRQGWPACMMRGVEAAAAGTGCTRKINTELIPDRPVWWTVITACRRLAGLLLSL